MPNRRKALKNPSDEFSKVVEVVSRYALRFPAVGFTCKKAESNQVWLFLAFNVWLPA